MLAQRGGGHALEPIQRGADGRDFEGAPGGAVAKGERPFEGFDDRILSLPKTLVRAGDVVRVTMPGWRRQAAERISM